MFSMISETTNFPQAVLSSEGFKYNLESCVGLVVVPPLNQILCKRNSGIAKNELNRSEKERRNKSKKLVV